MRIQPLDMLRGCAVLLVMLHHQPALGRPALLTGGWIGVDLFFALSGYLIAGILLTPAAATGWQRAREFWTRRCRRLMPALAMLTATWATLAMAGGPVSQALSRGYSDAAAQWNIAAGIAVPWTGLSNQWLIAGLPYPVSLGHLWSLAVEWQFYAIAPLIVLSVARTRSRAAGVTLLSAAAVACWIATAWHSQPGDIVASYAGTIQRMPALLAGAAAGIAASRHLPGTPWQVTGRTRVAVLATSGLLLAGTALVADKSSAAWLDWVGGIGIAAALLTWAVGSVTEQPAQQRTGKPGQAGRLLAWTGRRSYAAYLWNWPIVYASSTLVGTPASWTEALLMLAACWAATWGIAVASWHLIEKRWTGQGVARQPR